jgi:hypothetical protein
MEQFSRNIVPSGPFHICVRADIAGRMTRNSPMTARSAVCRNEPCFISGRVADSFVGLIEIPDFLHNTLVVWMAGRASLRLSGWHTERPYRAVSGAAVLWELQQKADYLNWHSVADVAAERHHISNPVRVTS